MVKNALALEYQGDYGTARGDIDILDLINNPTAGGKCRVFGPGFSEEIADLALIHTGVFRQNRPDPESDR